MTLCFAGLAIVTGSLSLQQVLNDMLKRDVIQLHRQTAESLSKRTLNLCVRTPRADCIEEIISELTRELNYQPHIQLLALISYPNQILGGAKRERPGVKVQSQELITPLPKRESFPLSTMPFETGRTVNTLFDVDQPTEVNEVGVPFYLPDGRRMAIIAHFELNSFIKRATRRSRLIWFILFLQSTIISLFSLILSRKHFVIPLEKLAHLTRSTLNRGGRSAPPLSDGPKELMMFQENFLEMLERLRHESVALAEANLALTQQGGLITAGLISASVMHEIGNPLASVIGLLEFLRSMDDVGEEEHKLLERCQVELDRIRVITRQLIDIAKPPEYDIQPTSLYNVLDWTQDMLWYQSSHREVDIHLEVDLSIVVYVDENALKHALLNLFINAAQAMNGQGHLWVSIDQNQPPPSDVHIQSLALAKQDPKLRETTGVIVHLIDSGPGVNGDHKDEIFKIFSSTKGDAGSGLGLGIASLLIEECGGYIWLNESMRATPSHESRGACFSVWLPSDQFKLDDEEA